MGGGQSTAAAGPPGPNGEPPAEAPPPQPSYWQMVRSGYFELVNAIIRPPRAEYAEAQLGPREFEFCGQRFRRRDFEVTNERGQRLRCSHWEPFEYPDAPDDGGGSGGGKLPCMVYLHGNSSARLEALPQLSLCLSLGVTLAALDFAGSGLSEGEYVSLGYYEKDDLKALVAALRATGRVSCVALWGRSMGAVTALMHGERDPGIAAMVLDSPFSDLSVLADEMVDKGREHGVHVPRFVTRLALRGIRASVQQRAGFSITALAAIQHAPRCFMPALFVAGRDDDFIAPSHSRALQAAYGGDSNLLVVEGDHNSMRPRFLYDSVSIFLQQTLPLNEEYVLPGASRLVGLPPWVRIVTDGRGGEVVLWPHIHEDGEAGEGEEEDGDEEGYWIGPHVYDDVGHPGSILSGRAGASVSRPGAGITREEGVILGDSGEAGSGAWGESDGQLGFGMTEARQREIQGAVVSMMGGSGGNSSSSRGGRAPSPFARTTGRRNLAASGSSSTNGDAAAAAAEWACELCTLINPGRRNRCEACGSAKPPVPRSLRNNNNNNGAPRSPLLSPVPLEPPGGVAAAGAIVGEGGEYVPPENAVQAQAQGGGGPLGAVGGEEGKEEETEEAKAADPNV